MAGPGAARTLARVSELSFEFDPLSDIDHDAEFEVKRPCLLTNAAANLDPQHWLRMGTNPFSRELLQDVNEAVEELSAVWCDAFRNGRIEVADLAQALHEKGYPVTIRTSLPGGGSDCFKKLGHSFLVVQGTGEFEGIEVIVEHHLRQHFAIPHPTPEYAQVLASVPNVFVGSVCRLLPLVQLLCGCMAESFEQQGLALPPWRREQPMLSKWSPSPSRYRDQAYLPASATTPSTTGHPTHVPTRGVVRAGSSNSIDSDVASTPGPRSAGTSLRVVECVVPVAPSELAAAAMASDVACYSCGPFSPMSSHSLLLDAANTPEAGRTLSTPLQSKSFSKTIFGFCLDSQDSVAPVPYSADAAGGAMPAVQGAVSPLGAGPTGAGPRGSSFAIASAAGASAGAIYGAAAAVQASVVHLRGSSSIGDYMVEPVAGMGTVRPRGRRAPCVSSTSKALEGVAVAATDPRVAPTVRPTSSDSAAAGVAATRGLAGLLSAQIQDAFAQPGHLPAAAKKADAAALLGASPTACPSRAAAAAAKVAAPAAGCIGVLTTLPAERPGEQAIHLVRRAGAFTVTKQSAFSAK